VKKIKRQELNFVMSRGTNLGRGFNAYGRASTLEELH
jgi:hypothetical protein